VALNNDIRRQQLQRVDGLT